MKEILPQDPVALLKAVSSMLPPEVAEQVRQALAIREQRYINRGVSVNDPSSIDDIDPTNQAMAILMHEHPGVLYNFGINGSTLAGFTLDKEKFVIVAADLVEQHRRQILEIIISDYLGNRPAVELAGDDLVTGLFLFSGNKLYPRALSEKNLKLFIDYFEQMGNNPEIWTCPYWLLADTRSREVAHWLPPE